MDGVDAGGGSPSPEQGGPTGRGSKARGARRVVRGVAVAAAVAVGGLTVAAVNPLGGAGAEEGTPTTEVAAGAASAPTTPPSPDADAAPAESAGRDHGGSHRLLDEALAALVHNGVLTQAQADAVTAEVTQRAEAARSERRDAWDARRQEMLDAAASVFGLTGEQLADELKAGKTLDQLASEHGVDAQKISDALVTGANEQIDAAVAGGHLDAARAAELKEKFVQRIPDLVDAGAALFGGRD